MWKSDGAGQGGVGSGLFEFSRVGFDYLEEIMSDQFVIIFFQILN
jgi:hypothetical protein